VRPSIFDPSPLLFLDTTDSLPGVTFAFLLPWIYLVPCTISRIISFFIRRTGLSFSLCRRHTAIFTFPLDIHYNRQHYPWPIHHPSHFTFYSLLFSYLLPPSLYYFYFVLYCCFMFADILFPCRLMIHFLTCLVNVRSFGSYRFRTTRI